MKHAERAHSKFSASGSERWLNCSASVELEENSPPSIDTHWSKEGTLAHEVLECVLNRTELPLNFGISSEMIAMVEKVASKVRAIHKAYGGTMLVEKKVFNNLIHEEMFGTCDVIIAGGEGTLHILDLKYGQGHIVSPEENTQLIQYALAVAESYDWGFHTVKLWILQPRAGSTWYKSWSMPMSELKDYWFRFFKKGVERVLQNKSPPKPGSWCHWCRAKLTCPAKQGIRAEKISNVFEENPIEKGKNYGEEKEKSKTKAKEKESRGPKKSSGWEESAYRKKKALEDEAEAFGYFGYD